MKNTQPIKSIQQFKIIQDFQAITFGDICQSDSFRGYICFSKIKNSYVSIMSYENPCDLDYFLTKNVDSLVFMLSKLTAATTKTLFKIHSISMKTFYETFLMKLTTFFMPRTSPSYTKPIIFFERILKMKAMSR